MRNPENQMKTIYNDFKQKEPEKFRLFLLIVSYSVFYKFYRSIKIIVDYPEDIHTGFQGTHTY
jgi:hypothetical protein